jgi:hypothetical protein
LWQVTNRQANIFFDLAPFTYQPRGTAVNLNFEGATIAPTPVGGSTYPADPIQAFPGWVVGGAGTVVMYNDLSLGAPAVVLMGPNFPNLPGYTPLQGSYSVLLQYFGIAGGPPALSQTAVVPAEARSISILVPSGQNSQYPNYFAVSLNGISIPLVSTADGRVSGDVSAFAGTRAELTLSTVNSSVWLYFDDVQFSTTPAPEASTSALFVIGALLFGFNRRWQQSLNPGDCPTPRH